MAPKAPKPKFAASPYPNTAPASPDYYPEIPPDVQFQTVGDRFDNPVTREVPLRPTGPDVQDNLLAIDRAVPGFIYGLAGFNKDNPVGSIAREAILRKDGKLEGGGVATGPDKSASSSPSVPMPLMLQPPPASTGTSSVTIRKGRPIDQGYLDELQATEGSYLGEKEKLARRQSEINAEHTGLLRRYADDYKVSKERFKGVADESLAEYKSVAADLKRARDELRAMKIEPNRLWDSMPRSQQVLTAIGKMLGEMGEQASRGQVANSIGRWWATAREQDIALQREAIKLKMEDVRMTSEERNALWRQWLTAEDEIRKASDAAAKMELAKIAVDTDDVTLKGDLAKAIRESGQLRNVAAHGEFVAHQDIVTKHYSSGGGTKAGAGTAKEAPVGIQISLQNAIPALRGIQAIRGALEKYNPWATGEGMFSGDETRKFNAVQNVIKDRYVKFVTGAQHSDKEMARYDKRFIIGYSPLGQAGAERSREQQLAKLDSLEQDGLRYLESIVRSYPDQATRALLSAPDLLQKVGIDPRSVPIVIPTRGGGKVTQR